MIQTLGNSTNNVENYLKWQFPHLMAGGKHVQKKFSLSVVSLAQAQCAACG